MQTEGTITILLVEDDIIDIMAVQRLFRQFSMGDKYKLYIAHNGQEALDMLHGNDRPPITPRPQVILLDLNMPKMNGFEFLQHLRSNPDTAALRVIILSTTTANAGQMQALAGSNIAGYIIKPITLPQFVEAITTLNTYHHQPQPKW
jgi:CheY-like chemotaxis protein